jgi:hypothetical protein
MQDLTKMMEESPDMVTTPPVRVFAWEIPPLHINRGYVSLCLRPAPWGLQLQACHQVPRSQPRQDYLASCVTLVAIYWCVLGLGFLQDSKTQFT